MKNTKKYFGHVGDVQMIECKMPSNAKPVERCPVAYGEKSNHIHVITGDYEMFEDENFKYIKVGPNGALSQHCHQSIWDKNVAGYDTLELLEKADHKPATKLPPNKVVKIGIHQSYNPYKKIQEKVID